MEHPDDNEETKTQYFSTTNYSGGEMFAYSAAPPPQPKEPAVRPLIVTVICILGLIGSTISLMVGLVQFVRVEVVTWDILFLVVGAAANLVAYIGIWKMQLWGLYILILMFLVTVVVIMNTTYSGTLSLSLSTFLLLILGLNSKKMQ